jgi:hypothetical protein
MAYQTFTIQNFNTTTPAVINRFTFDDNANVTHLASFTGWNSPWSISPTASNDTRRTASPTFIYASRSASPTYLYHTGTALLLSSIDNIEPGWTVTGGNYDTVVASTSGTSWVITDDGPSSQPNPSATINFTPPQYLLQVDDITQGGITIEPSFIASSNGYTTNQSVLSTSGTQWLVMSDEPNGNPSATPIVFYSTNDEMYTLAPAVDANTPSSVTFELDYNYISPTPGSYRSDITIFATLVGPVQKDVTTYVYVNSAPIDTGGGGGFDGGFGGDSGDSGVSDGPGPGGNSAGDANAGDGGNGSSADGSGSDGGTATA